MTKKVITPASGSAQTIYYETNDTLTQINEKHGNRSKEHQEVVPRALELIEFQILQIRKLLHKQTDINRSLYATSFFIVKRHCQVARQTNIVFACQLTMPLHGRCGEPKGSPAFHSL